MNNMSNTSSRNRSEQVRNHEINRSHTDKEKIAKGWENLSWQYMFETWKNSEKNEKTRDIRVQKAPLATPTIFNKGELESTMPTFCRPKALDCISSPAWLVRSCSTQVILKLMACDFHVSMSFLKFSPFFRLNFWSWSLVFLLLSLRFCIGKWWLVFLCACCAFTVVSNRRLSNKRSNN